MSDISLTFAGAGIQDVPIPEGLKFFAIRECDADVYITINHEREILRGVGERQDFAANRRVQSLKVRSTIAQTVKVVVGPDDYTDSRSTLNATVNTVENPANQNIPLAEVSVGAGATVLLAAADATRQALRVGVKSSEANGVYVGDISTGAVTQGGYIEEGSADYIASEAAIYAYNPGAGSVTVNLLKMNRV